MHLFDRDTALEAHASDQFEGVISENWSVNGIPNGGYLLALTAGSLLETSDKKETPILTVNYLSRCVPGPVSLSVETISRSKQFNRLQARLVQDGHERLRTMATFATAVDECFMVRYESAPPKVAPVSECVAIPQMPNYTIYDQMDVRLDPSCVGWMQGHLSEKSEHKGWIAFRDERPFDLLSIALAADAFPPPIMASQGLIAWVPTIELSINIRSVPKVSRLKCVFRTRYVNCGLLEEDGEIWDEGGQLVAISRQIAQFRQISG